MVFLPSFWLGFDPRWIGLALWAIISIIFILIPIKGCQKESFWYVFVIRRYEYSFSSNFISMDQFSGLWPYLWFVVVADINEFGVHEKAVHLERSFSWNCFSLTTNRFYLCAFVVCLLGFTERVGSVSKIFFISVFVFGIIVLPFLIQSPQQFLIAPIQHYQRLGDYAMAQGQSGWTANAIGFSYVIQEKWGADVLSKILGLAALLLATMSFFVIKNVKGLLVYAAFSVTVFSFFTPIPWMYEYFPALLFLTLALFSEE